MIERKRAHRHQVTWDMQDALAATGGGGTAVDVREALPDSRTASGEGIPAGFSKLVKIGGGGRAVTRLAVSDASTRRCFDTQVAQLWHHVYPALVTRRETGLSRAGSRALLELCCVEAALRRWDEWVGLRSAVTSRSARCPC